MEEVVTLPAIGKDERVVAQLDQVTRDSEKKATEVFEKLENLLNYAQNVINISNELRVLIEQSSLEDKAPYEKFIKELNSSSNTALDEIEAAMNIMQYQDIHRQKIERVINIVRALNNYMNTLFSSDIKDEERASSAQYIAGDSNKEDVLSDEEIEQMLKEFSNK